MKRRDLIAALAGGAIATLLAGVAAWAAIPGPAGVIQGCYDSGGNVKVVEALPCPPKYTPFSWNQQGVQGIQGPKGDKGDPGLAGPKGDRGEAGAGISRLEDLNGLPCSSPNFVGEVALSLSEATIGSDSAEVSVALHCVTEDVATLRVRLIGLGTGTVSEANIGFACAKDDVFAERTCETTGLSTQSAHLHLRANPLPGSVFAEWTAGPCAGSTDAACEVVLDRDVEVVASFRGA